MTRAQMMEIALAAVQVSGVAYVTDPTNTAQLNAVANRRMLMFAEKTRCLYSDAITFDLSPNGTIPSNGIYNLRDTTYTFGKAICELESITIDGSPLRDLDGKIGLTPLKALRVDNPGYLGTAASKPKHASIVSPKSMRLWPVPDGSYSNNFASGWYLPAAIDTTSGGDNTDIEFNDEDGECCAYYVAIGLVMPTAATETDYQRMSFFSKPAADYMANMTSESENQMSGGLQRGYQNFPRVGSLG